MEECIDRVIVKSVPDDDDIARFREIIVLCENDIIYCSQVWRRFGMDRGVYKAVLTTALFYYVPKWYYFIKRKFFII